MPAGPDTEALAVLFEEHRLRLQAVLDRRLDPALKARLGPEDLLSRVFLKARRQYAWFASQNALAAFPWLYRLALDCVRDAWRYHNRAARAMDRELRMPEQSSVQLGLGLIDSGTSPSDAVVRGETQELVRRAVSLLKDDHREILWLRHLDGLSYAEAAQVLGISENAATVRHARALKEFKSIWLQLHPDSH